MIKTHRTDGQILLEGLLAVVVLSMVVLAVVPMLSFLLRRTATTQSENEAGLLLQEAMESTYNIFTSNWTSYPDGTYYPAKSASNKWALVSGTQTNLETLYTRSIQIQRACRDQNGELVESTASCGGQVDPDSKIVTAKVSWNENGNEKNLTAEYLLVNLKINN